MIRTHLKKSTENLAPVSSEVASMTETSEPKLPHEQDQSVTRTKVKPSKPMQQAHRDVSRGLVDTDRGPEADRTYRKLTR